ncbi:MAG TPA: TIGR00282 family metallophosphoesterase [Fimbriimonadaceae bacterium]|nr:TIGR00282 family metallophosphoesterase [Fimbriimonadaceae bacterium]
MSYRILFLGDVVGRPGRDALQRDLPRLKQELTPLFTLVNGENAAGGVGITPDIAQSIFGLGVDAITLGNHAYNKREIFPYLNTEAAIVRPANMPAGNPGRGSLELTKDGVTLFVANLCGRVFMDAYDDPFRAVDQLLEGVVTPHRLIDFHAEATSEKIAMAWHLDGRATAVIGTHTHVPTADERILPGGTAAITDVGMTGPYESVLGMSKEIVLARFKTGMPARFEVADAMGVISGVVLDVERLTGRATAIRRVRPDS